MNTNIIYISNSGNTKKLAEAIGEAINIEPIDITKEHILPDTDLLFVGTGIYGGKPNEKMIDYIDNLPANKIKGAVIFGTSASGKDNSQLLVNCLRAKNIEVYSQHYFCKGKFWFISKKHPNDVDLDRVSKFAKYIVEKI